MDKQARKFNEHWTWWKVANAVFLRDATEHDMALSAAASAWNAGVEWGRQNPIPPKPVTGG